MTSPVQTTKASFLQIEAICDEKYVQRWILNKHNMFMDDDIFFYLYQSGLLDRIVNLFEAEDRKKKNAIGTNGQKRTYEDIDEDNQTNSDSAQREEELGRKKSKGINTNVADTSTQIECPLSMVSSSSSSSLPSVDPSPLTTIITTTAVRPVCAYATLEKNRYQCGLFVMHKMLLRKSDISLLDHHGLLDQLVELLESIDRTRNKSYRQPMSNKDSVELNTVHEQFGIAEGQKKEEEEEDDDDDDDDDDEDDEFESPTEDEDNEQNNQCGCCMFLEEHEEQNSIHGNASTQTTGDLIYNLLDIETNSTGKLFDYI
jgi:hypothetical protein